MNESTKIIYKTRSAYVFYKYLIIRMAALIISITAFYHFNDNPIVTVIIGTFFLIAFLIIGEDELIIYSDRIRYFSRSLLKRFLFSRKLELSNIKSFKVDGDFGFKLDAVSDNSHI